MASYSLRIDTDQYYADGQILAFGSDQDATLTHSGSALTIANATGNTTIQSAGATSSLILKLGTATTATKLSVQSSAGTELFVVKGDGSRTTTGGETSSTSATYGVNGSSGSTLTLTLDSVNSGAGAGNTVLTADDGVTIGDAGNPTIDFPGTGAITHTGNPTIGMGTGALTLGGTALSSTGALAWTLKANDAAALSIGPAAAPSQAVFVSTTATPKISLTPGLQTTPGTHLSIAGSINHATASAVGVGLSLTASTTARTSGTYAGFEAEYIGLAGDTSGTQAAMFSAKAPTKNGGSATVNAFAVGSGFTNLMDLAAVGTGEANVKVKDNIASAFEILEGGTSYFKIVTTNGTEAVAIGKQIVLGTVTLAFGSGAPSGTLGGTLTTASAIYLRTDPSNGSTVLYTTHNTGTNWYAAVFA